ncbi:MAG TPA: hypothetical protein VFY18_03920 [Candidatus Limnocylindrales bacterium]|nr:hypothetical protein [Candidatus Limnocylindrales bacterium]
MLPRKARNGWLLVASLFFYTWGAGWIVLVLIASIGWKTNLTDCERVLRPLLQP